MRARWYESAFGAAALDEQLALQVDGGLLELIEALKLELLPNVLLRQMGTLFDNLSLLLVQPVVEAWARRLMMVAKWLFGPLEATFFGQALSILLHHGVLHA